MQYCIYLRKSRADSEAEARGEGETLARHEKTLLELAKRMRLNISQIYREVVSGETIAARPVMQQLLSEIEKGVWSGVLVMEVERLARGDTIDQGIVAQTFKLSGTKIITPMKTYDPENEFDEEYFEFGLFMSRREYKTINRRLQRGRLASVKEGKYVANQPPYGYLRKKLPSDKGYTLEPHPEQADVIRMIFEYYTIGELQPDGTRTRLGLSLIVRRLNALKIPPKKGTVWSLASVRDIIINPVYIGMIRWNWRPVVKKVTDGQVTIARPRANDEECVLVKGLHPPIIDEKTFYMAQEYISHNRARPIGERNTVKNPLSGLVVCEKCGHHMVRRPYNKNSEQPDTLICPYASCDNISSALHFVESKVLRSLSEWVASYKVEWELSRQQSKVSPINIKQKTVKKLEAELQTLHKQLENVYDLVERGIYTTDDFLERSRTISERIDQTKKDLAQIRADIELDLMREESRRDIIPKVEKLLEVYNDLHSAKAKNDMLKEVIEKITYIKNKNGRWHNRPDDFDIVLYPKLPTVGKHQ